MRNILAPSMLISVLLAAWSPAAHARLAAPSPVSPDDEAQVAAVPAFSWSKVSRADRYEFELSADRNFGSIVLGRGNGSFTTRNLAATITKSLPDGQYWWRVRAVSAKNKAGAWSPRRSIHKRWGSAPELLGPSEDVAFPNVPLVLRWSAVPRAYKYRVSIASDPALGTLVVGREPIETSATAFGPGVNLPPGRYYWAVEPVDVAGHRGLRSAVGAFTWSWSSATSTAYADLVDDARLADPHVSWNPIPGAVGYEVEINHADEFAPGSKVCCSESVVGTSLSPKTILSNNIYHWRVRGIDPDGNRGQWNRGPDFDKNFGDVPPTIANLRIADHRSDQNATDVDLATPALLDTDSPVVRWDPLPGAASYRIKVWPHNGSGCDLTASGYTAEVAGAAWTPLKGKGGGVNPPIPTPSSVLSTLNELVPGTSYCVDVYAISGNTGVRSDVSRLGGTSGPAFRYAPVTPANLSPVKMASEKYLSPPQGSTNPRLPVYRWDPVDGAESYWIYVSRDDEFTNLVDVALTRVPVYAPRANLSPRTYRDEDTPYYWAILPAANADGSDVTYRPPEDGANAPFTFFSKRSVPPAQVTPPDGADVSEPPVFRWTSGDASIAVTEGAKSYLLQVATDTNFGDLVDEVTTQATSYTAQKAYPADTVLYWRVRATDVTGTGLGWSAIRTFRRRLPAPSILDSNPEGGATIPPFLWTPVQGATSYDVHVDQADGTRKEFNVRGAAFTPTFWYGTGIWRWQVRARFPNGGGTVASAYSGFQPFARTIPSPDGVRAVNSGGRVLIAWEPNVGVKEYKVDISDSDSFATVGQSIRTHNLAVAPDVSRAPFVNGGTLYWRVTAIDEGGNLGGAAVGKLVTARRMSLSVQGGILRGQRSKVKVIALNAANRKIRRVKVRLSGRPIRGVSRRTNKRGAATFRVRARRAGKVKIRATRTGYRPAIHVLTVPR